MKGLLNQSFTPHETRVASSLLPAKPFRGIYIKNGQKILIK